MSNTDSIKYSGNWYFPKCNTMMQQNLFEDCIGTLYYYKDKPSVLEIYHKPINGIISSMFNEYETVIGEDANGNKFTLFNVKMKDNIDMSKTTFTIGYFLIGNTIKLEFDCCNVRFPYLRKWAYKRIRNISLEDESITTILDKNFETVISEIELEEGVKLILKRDCYFHNALYETTFKEDTILQIKSENPLSIRGFSKIIYIFKQFLSIALYGEQNPCSIEFRIDSKNKSNVTKVLFPIEKSQTPYIVPLLKFDKISHKISEILQKWYSNFEQMSPICDYFIQSTQVKPFETPNFLIIAQALDGYHKRFINKKNGKDIRIYKDQINLLLEYFKDITQLQKCKLDADVLTQSRHKYSHLIPDDDVKIQKAVDGSALVRLTYKAMVLLACCILDYLGLTIDEINDCLDNSEISQIVGKIAFYEN